MRCHFATQLSSGLIIDMMLQNTNMHQHVDIKMSIIYYYYKQVLLLCRRVQKKLQEHLTTKKNKTNDSGTWVKNRSQTVRDQTSGWSFKGDQRLHMKITKIRDYASRQSVCPVTQTYNHLRNLQHNLPTTLKTLADSEKFQQIQDAED